MFALSLHAHPFIVSSVIHPLRHVAAAGRVVGLQDETFTVSASRRKIPDLQFVTSVKICWPPMTFSLSEEDNSALKVLQLKKRYIVVLVDLFTKIKEKNLLLNLRVLDPSVQTLTSGKLQLKQEDQQHLEQVPMLPMFSLHRIWSQP